MQQTPIDNIVLSPEELQHLSELREVLQTAATPGWMLIMKRLEELVEQAHEDMLGRPDAPDNILAALTRRWQQREAVLRDIRLYISSCEAEKEDILSRLPKENTDGED